MFIILFFFVEFDLSEVKRDIPWFFKKKMKILYPITLVLQFQYFNGVPTLLNTSWQTEKQTSPVLRLTQTLHGSGSGSRTDSISLAVQGSFLELTNIFWWFLVRFSMIFVHGSSSWLWYGFQYFTQVFSHPKAKFL